MDIREKFVELLKAGRDYVSAKNTLAALDISKNSPVVARAMYEFKKAADRVTVILDRDLVDAEHVFIFYGKAYSDAVPVPVLASWLKVCSVGRVEC